MKVSVIVPVYNVQDYLERCLDSLVHQTLEEIEILVVDDGSTDGSPEIIRRYQERYPQIRMFSKKNGGLSDARNYALPYATGEYVGYVDSDDYVEHDMFEKLYREAKKQNYDVVECNLCHEYEDGGDVEIGARIYDKKEMIMNGRSVVWNKIYRRSWLLGTGVVFPKGLIYEDVEFYVRLVPHMGKISYIEDACIHYVQRKTSLNYGTTLKTMDILKILADIRDSYREEGLYETYREALEFLHIRILLCSSFRRMVRIPDKRDRKMALEAAWHTLEDNFPNWKQNTYLRKLRTKKGWYMRAMNRSLYRICGTCLPYLYKIR